MIGQVQEVHDHQSTGKVHDHQSTVHDQASTKKVHVHQSTGKALDQSTGMKSPRPAM